MRPVCSDVQELLEPHALGLLEGDEAALVEAHLQACPACRRISVELADTAASLPRALAAASPLRPPANLRTRMLAGLPQQVDDGERAGASAIAVGARERTGDTPLRDMPPTVRAVPLRPWRAGWARPVGIAAVAAALAVSVAWSAQLGVALARERALRQDLALELAAAAGQQEIVLEVVDARDGVRRFLSPVAGAPAPYARSYGKVFSRPNLAHVVAMVGRMPALPAGQAYHLWLTEAGQVKLVGTIAVNGDGFGQLVFDADRNGPVYEAALVTRQPPGAVAPGGMAVLRWEAPRG